MRITERLYYREPKIDISRNAKPNYYWNHNNPNYLQFPNKLNDIISILKYAINSRS